MKKSKLNRVWTLAFVLLPFALLTGCAPEEEAGATQDGTEEFDQTRTDQTEEQRMDRGAETERGTQIDLSAKNQSNVSGSATITPIGGEMMRVQINLQGAEQGQQYPTHIHQGTCDEGGPVVLELDPVTPGQQTGMRDQQGQQGQAGQQGQQGQQDRMGQQGQQDQQGQAVSTRELQSGQDYFLQTHAPDGQPVACADIPQDALQNQQQQGQQNPM